MKLAFLVEGDWDRVLVEAFARRLLPDDVRTHTVRFGGRAEFTTAYTTVLTLLARGFDRFVCVFDTEFVSDGAEAEQRRRIEAPLAERDLLSVVSVCPAVPYTEAWLLAGLGERPDPAVPPREQLRQKLGVDTLRPEHVADAVAIVSLDAVERASPSFARFAAILRSMPAAQPVGGAS